MLIETTDLPLADVAFAAGFASVRQFNETVREVYAVLADRAARPRAGARSTGAVTMRLPVRTPFAGRRMLDFLAYHLVPGVEVAGPGWYARTLACPTARHRAPRAGRRPTRPTAPAAATGFVTAEFTLDDLRDIAAASERVRRLLDADCDPRAVDDHLADDPVLGALVRAAPDCASPARSTATRPRSAPSSASRSGSPAPARSPAGSSPSTGAPSSPTSRA